MRLLRWRVLSGHFLSFRVFFCSTKSRNFYWTRHDLSIYDDDELIVRASTVLKSQGQKTGPVGDPVSFGRAKARALSGADCAGKLVEWVG